MHHTSFKIQPSRQHSESSVLSKVFTAVLMDPVTACYLFQSVGPNADFTCAGRCYYIVVVPTSESTRQLKNPEEIGLEEVSASW